MGVTVSNVEIVQCTIFCWNPWTTNWIRHVWNRSATNFETWCRWATLLLLVCQKTSKKVPSPDSVAAENAV